MAPSRVERLRRLLPALWLGLLGCVAFIAAPAPFAVLAPIDAGRVNGRIFVQEAWTSVALALVLWLLERGRARRASAAGQGSVLSTEMVMLVGTLLDELERHERPLARLTTRHVSLEDVFVSLTGRHLRDDETNEGAPPARSVGWRNRGRRG